MRREQLASRRGRVLLLVILGSLSAFAPMSLDLYLPAFPSLAASMGTTTSAVQVTLSASLLGLGLGQLLYGPLSDRYGRRPPLVVGLGLFVVASVACALAPTIPILTGFRFIQALGGCAGIVIARAIVRDCYSGRDLARTLSLMVMVFALAPVLAPSIGALILAWATWPWIFIALALFGAYCLVGVLVLPETLLPELRTSHGFQGAVRSYAGLARSGAFMVPALIAGCGSMVIFAYISSSPAVLIDTFGVTPRAFALIFGGISLCFVLGAQVNMRLLHRYSVHSLLRGFLITQTVATALVLAFAALRLPLPFILLAIALAMSCVGGVGSNAVAEALLPFPDRAGSAAALIGVMQMGLGALVSALLAGLPFPPATEMGAMMLSGAGLGLGLLLKDHAPGK